MPNEILEIIKVQSKPRGQPFGFSIFCINSYIIFVQSFSFKKGGDRWVGVGVGGEKIEYIVERGMGWGSVNLSI